MFFLNYSGIKSMCPMCLCVKKKNRELDHVITYSLRCIKKARPQTENGLLFSRL
jgi:hypothetical protein